MKDMVQVRITAPGKHFIPEGYVRQGQVLWVRRDRAEILINKQRIAASVAGPSETKPGGPTEGKASAAGDQPTRSTASASSSGDGTGASSSVLREDRASRSTIYEESLKSGVVAKKPRRPKRSA